MVLTHKYTQRVDLPHEPGEWVQMRYPSYLHLQEARQARIKAAMESMAGLDDGLFQRLAKAAPPSAAESEDPLLVYEWRTILGALIVSWSYAEEVTPETIAELDEDTIRVLMGAAVPQKRSDDGQKNGSELSTSSSTVEATPLRLGSSPASAKS